MVEAAGVGERAEAGARVESSLFESLPPEFAAICDSIRGLVGDLAKRAEDSERLNDHSGDNRSRPSHTPRARFIEAITVKVDRERVNQSILIDGERGAGKTSLLLNLLHQWREELLSGRPARMGEAGKGEFVPVIPLGIIDLLPLPQNMELAMVLVSRLRKVMDELRGTRTTDAHGSSRGLFRGLSTPDPNGLYGAWNDLAGSIAAWSGHLNERRASMDSDAFIDELTLETRSGIGLDRTLRRFIDILTEQVHEALGTARRPIFVLPIDDADMNPRKGPELIYLLRTFYHPRLVFLLTGNSRLFQQTLTYQFAREIDGSDVTAFDDVERGRLANESRELARQIYDRAIAVNHRFRIQPRHHNSRLGVLVEKERSIKTELSRVLLLGAWKGKTLDWLLAPEPRDANIALERFQELIPGQLRSLVDLHGWLRRRSSSFSAIEFAEYLFSESISQAKVDENLRQRLEKILWASPTGERVFNASSIRLRGSMTLDSTPFIGPKSRTWLRSLLTVEASLRSVRRDNQTPIQVPDRVGEVIRLLLDLTSQDRPESAFRSVGTRRLFAGGAHALLATESDLITDAESLRWPMPQWFTSLDYELASASLRASVRNSGLNPLTLLVRSYFRILLTLALGRVDQLVSADNSWEALSALALDWENELESERTLPATRRGNFDLWFTQALIVFAPEFGLPPEDAQRGLEVFDTRLRHDDAVASIRRSRIDTIRVGLKPRESETDAGRIHRAETIVQALEGDHPDHPFHRITKIPSIRPTAPTRRTFPLLDRELKEEDLFLGSGPQTLLGYLRGPICSGWFQDSALGALEERLQGAKVSKWSRSEVRDHLLRSLPPQQRQTPRQVRLGYPFKEELSADGVIQFRPWPVRDGTRGALSLLLHNLIGDTGIRNTFPEATDSKLVSLPLLMDADLAALYAPAPRLPLPNFDSPYDRELTAHSWNLLRDDATGKHGSVLVSFLRLITVIFEERRVVTPTSGEKAMSELVQCIESRLAKPVVTPAPPRRAIYYNWLRAFPIYTAPEFGMDEDLAERLLNAFRTSELRPIDSRRISELRLAAQTDGDPVASLATWDNDPSSDHPFRRWLKSQP